MLINNFNGQDWERPGRGEGRLRTGRERIRPKPPRAGARRARHHLFPRRRVQAGDGGGEEDDRPRVDARGAAQEPPACRQPHEGRARGGGGSGGKNGGDLPSGDAGNHRPGKEVPPDGTTAPCAHAAAEARGGAGTRMAETHGRGGGIQSTDGGVPPARGAGRASMAEVTRAEATAQVRRTIGAYRDRVHEARNDTNRLPPEGARIVNEYCSFENDWQELVQDAIWETSFLDMMDDGLLLEYCAVCMDLDEVLELGSWRIGRVDRIIGVAELSYSEKIKKAIGYSDILGEILEEVGDINALVKQMVMVSGGLIALSFTGIGTVAEALGLSLLLVGASFSGTELLAGIVGLVKFFTEVYDAKTEEDLKSCGKFFGDAVAKIGVHGLFFVLSLFGLKKVSARLTAKTIAESKPNLGKWTWKSFKENVLKVEGKGSIKIDSNKVRYSQSSVNGSAEIIESMKAEGWKGEPIDIVKMLDGEYTTLDNTRLYAAQQTGIDVKACIHNYYEPLSPEQAARFSTPKKGTPMTWGEAVEYRINKQNASYRNNNPAGSWKMQDYK